MDLITESLLTEFSEEYGLNSLPEDDRFEHFSAFITARRHYTETFAPSDIVVGAGGDLGIDAIAIIVNGTLITELSDLEDLLATAPDYLDVAFIFIQAKRSSSFEVPVIGHFADGVEEFFNTQTLQPRNQRVFDLVEIMSAIYARSSKFKRGAPSCRLYYVTTGRWVGDIALEARRAKAIDHLRSTELFKDVEFTPIGAGDIQKLYSRSKNSISREFVFQSRQDIPEIPGVDEAYVGFIPAKAFLPLICDENGEIIRSIFYDNVRDFQDYNEVNSEMKSTLLSDRKSRFVLMNNGITIISRSMSHTGSRFYIEDFQIVNGCQTSHVLFDQREKLDDTVMVPLRLIWTQNEEIIQDIIHATNKQTEIQSDQFFAVTEFARHLETYFKSLPEVGRLFYERRSRQYDRLSIEKTRIVVQASVVRAFAGMFLSEPHNTVRSYKSLSAKVGKEIFVDGHKLSSYYTAAFTLYKLEYLFRNQKVDKKYRIARFQILLAFRLLTNSNPLPPLNSKQIDNFCKPICDRLYDATKTDDVFAVAIAAVDSIAGGQLDRDSVHTLTFTDKLIKYCIELCSSDKKCRV